MSRSPAALLGSPLLRRGLLLSRSLAALSGSLADPARESTVAQEPSSPARESVTFYEAVGGESTFRRLVDRFYAGVAGDPVLRPLYPDADLSSAAERLRMFLEQYWGGPAPTPSSAGIPRLRQRHAPFASVQPSATRGCATCARPSMGSSSTRATPPRCGTTSSAPPCSWSTRSTTPDPPSPKSLTAERAPLACARSRAAASAQNLRRSR